MFSDVIHFFGHHNRRYGMGKSDYYFHFQAYHFAGETSSLLLYRYHTFFLGDREDSCFFKLCIFSGRLFFRSNWIGKGRWSKLKHWGMEAVILKIIEFLGILQYAMKICNNHIRFLRTTQMMWMVSFPSRFLCSVFSQG